MSVKLKIILISAVILIITILFGMWRITSIKLDNTQRQLTEVSAQLDTATKENNRLAQYIQRRNTEIKALEQSYTEQLKLIPADICGDTKPSAELLEFFKKGR